MMRFSKILLFLAIQRFQQIHGSRLLLTPRGGRFIHWYDAWSTEAKVAAVSMMIGVVHNSWFQSSLAFLHWRKMWSTVSFSPQQLHNVLVSIPLFLRLSPVERAFLRTLQKKYLSFGIKGGFHTSFFHSKHAGIKGGVLVWPCMVSCCCVEKYPDFTVYVPDFCRG